MVLILLTSASLDTFAYDDQDVSLDNSYAEEYSYKNIDDGTEEIQSRNSCRAPDLSMDLQEQLTNIDTRKAPRDRF